MTKGIVELRKSLNLAVLCILYQDEFWKRSGLDVLAQLWFPHWNVCLAVHFKSTHKHVTRKMNC